MSERLPPNEWLGAAKALHVGQKRRINHGCGRTAACDVFNNGDSWSAYCHRCKQNGWVPKQHQSVQRTVVEPDRVQPVPASVMHLLQASTWEQRQIWDLLIEKGCPPGVIPEEHIWYSQEAGRILLRLGNRALGRALSPLRSPKWLTYGHWYNQPRMWWTMYRDVGPMVLVEDALSSYKVAKALQVYAPESCVSVAATLGTALTPESLAVVMGRDVINMYDGDPAGELGSRTMRRRLAVFGGKYSDRRPAGCDPKDLSLEHIYESIKDVL